MVVNSTALIPLFKYIFGVIHNNDLNTSMNDLIEMSEELKLRDNFENERYYRKILEEVIQILEISDEPDKIRNKITEFSENECGCCSVCWNCKNEFYKQLGRFLNVSFQEDESDKFKNQYVLFQVPKEFEKHFDNAYDVSEIYNQRYSSNRRERLFENKCIVLKGLSSTTPILLNNALNTNEFTGGGFFINWKGKGIAIDPGYHYIDNLHRLGLSVFDIDVVIVTHCHIDHNNDIRLIDELNHTMKLPNGCQKHNIVWYMDEISYDTAKKYQSVECGFDGKTNTIINIASIDNLRYEISENIIIQFFETKHIKSKKSNGDYLQDTFGCVLECKDEYETHRIGYSSDTCYLTDLSKCLGLCELLILNISGIREEDLLLIKKKDKHLGYFGCFQLLKDIYRDYNKLPDYVIISEFWNGKSDIRYDISKYLYNNIKKVCQEDRPCYIIPSGVGTVYDIEKKGIKCSVCGKYCHDIKIIRPQNRKEQIKYICDECCY